ncbi:MAG: hypothetical protein ACR2G6_15410 [Gemmatimonadaceae bacterium]
MSPGLRGVSGAGLATVASTSFELKSGSKELLDENPLLPKAPTAPFRAGSPSGVVTRGLAHALGKDTVILRQRGSQIPADIGGAHYHEYALDNLDSSADWLRQWLGG